LALRANKRVGEPGDNKSRSPLDIPSVLVAVDALVALGHGDEADAALGSLPAEHVREVSLYAELAAQRGDFDVALARLAHATGGMARALRGWLFIRCGKFAEAVRELRAASAVTASPSTLINLGYAYAALGSRRKAVRTTEIATGLSSGSLGTLASLNLVAYFIAEGDFVAARSVLDRLEHRQPHNLRVNLARAYLLSREGDNLGSLRELRRARSSHAYWASADERAEIAADVAYLEFRVGKRTRAEALKALHEQLVKTSHQSLGVANLMSLLTWKTSDAKSFEAVYQALRRVHAADEVLNLEAHLCMLRANYERAADLSAEWAQRCPFDEAAVVNAVYLLADGKNDFVRAAELGVGGLRRFPGSALLANDVAYAFAMAGDLQRARKYLPRQDCLPEVKATRGLISFLAGQQEEGLRQYDEAAEMAKAAGNDRNARAVLYRRDLLQAAASGAELPAPPAGYEDDVHFDLQRRAVGRAQGRLTEPQLPLFRGSGS
jgi:tetratricopeptide (TPR) repeat protein